MTNTICKKNAIYKLLKERIYSGEYTPSLRLPNENIFSGELGVSTITLRAALKKLEEEGMVCRIPGKGTFIADNPHGGNQILVLSPDGEERLHPHNYIIPGIAAGAEQAKLETDICFISYLRKLGAAEAHKLLAGKPYRGVLLLTSNYTGDEPEIELLRRSKLPVVMAQAAPGDRKTGFATLRINEREAWRLGLEHLIAKGHRRIGILTLSGSDSIRDWQESELTALMFEKGMDMSCRRIFSSELTPEAVHAAITEMFAVSIPPTAVYCYSDFFAIEAMNSLKQHQLRIPEDVAVMGFCGFPGATFLNPPLSTVDFCYNQMGRAAVRLLEAAPHWLKQGAPPDICSPVILRERESTRTQHRTTTLRDRIFQQEN